MFQVTMTFCYKNLDFPDNFTCRNEMMLQFSINMENFHKNLIMTLQERTV